MTFLRIKLTSVLVYIGLSLAYSQDIIIHVPVSQPKLMEVDAGEDIAADDPEIVMLGQDITVVGGTPEYMYRWTDPDNNVYEGQTIQGQTFGTYHLEVSDEKHCTALDSVELTSSTFILSHEEQDPIEFFPNPASGIIYFDGTVFGRTIAVNLVNTNGKIFFRKQILNSGDYVKLVIPPDLLGEGTYFILLSDGQTSRAGQIIIQ
jgi:hypothetical protein